jgi:hypothetical protein
VIDGHERLSHTKLRAIAGNCRLPRLQRFALKTFAPPRVSRRASDARLPMPITDDLFPNRRSLIESYVRSMPKLASPHTIELSALPKVVGGWPPGGFRARTGPSAYDGAVTGDGRYQTSQRKRRPGRRRAIGPAAEAAVASACGGQNPVTITSGGCRARDRRSGGTAATVRARRLG